MEKKKLRFFPNLHITFHTGDLRTPPPFEATPKFSISYCEFFHNLHLEQICDGVEICLMVLNIVNMALSSHAEHRESRAMMVRLGSLGALGQGRKWKFRVGFLDKTNWFHQGF